MKIQDKKSKELRVLMIVLGVCFLVNVVATPAFAGRGGGGRRGGGYKKAAQGYNSSCAGSRGYCDNTSRRRGAQGTDRGNSLGSKGAQGIVNRRQSRNRDGECISLGDGSGARKMYQSRENNTQRYEQRQNRRLKKQVMNTQSQENTDDLQP